MRSPLRILLTAHAEQRRAAMGLTRADIPQALCSQHGRRRRNPGSSDWLVEAAGLVVAYNWPHHDDSSSALVVTLYRDD